MPKKITEAQQKAYLKARDEGFSMRAAIVRPGVGFSIAYAQQMEKRRKNGMIKETKVVRDLLRLEEELPGPKPYADLCYEAQKAYNEFGFFQQYYFGRVAQPWQAEAAEVAADLLETPRQEYAVVNCPPGAGKTTLFTHDIPAWLTARDRTIRGLLGSATQQLANRYTDQLRMTLERPVAFPPDIKLLRRGLAVKPGGILTVDFGRFKPLERGVWTRSEFRVMQEGGAASIQKEPTWSTRESCARERPGRTSSGTGRRCRRTASSPRACCALSGRG